MTWPDGGTNEVTETIGKTGRNHSTIAAWEAATDENCVTGWGSGIYASPCSPVGVCYDDDDLAGFILSGATTDSTHYRRLTAAVGQRFCDKGNGTAYGDGVISKVAGYYSQTLTDLYGVVEWLILDSMNGYPMFTFDNPPANARLILRNCICHGTGTHGVMSYAMGANAECRAENCFIHSGSGVLIYNYAPASGAVFVARNCSALGGATGANQVNCTNVISCGASAACFYNCTGDYNISSDQTAPGAHSNKGQAAVDQFVNIGAGTEDLHLLSSSAAVNTGTDLSAYFTIDIDGQTRPTQDGTNIWDIGADEYVAPAAGSSRRRRLLCGAR